MLLVTNSIHYLYQCHLYHIEIISYLPTKTTTNLL
nr:MAG TPA: hypothetical protein [Bacteriophage sp.]